MMRRRGAEGCLGAAVRRLGPHSTGQRSETKSSEHGWVREARVHERVGAWQGGACLDERSELELRARSERRKAPGTEAPEAFFEWG